MIGVSSVLLVIAGVERVIRLTLVRLLMFICRVKWRVAHVV